MIDLKEIKELALKASGNSQPVRMFHADEAIFRDIDLSTVHLWEALSPPVVLELISRLESAEAKIEGYVKGSEALIKIFENDEFWG